MIEGREYVTAAFHPGVILTQQAMSSIMSFEDSDESLSGKKTGGSPPGKKDVLFQPDDLDIYCNKITLDAYIFHGPKVDYESIGHLEYDPKNYTVDVVLKNGKRLDLGVKIQWLVRPYFSKAQMINIVQTKDGESIDGTVVPLVHKEGK